jgi:hypothetical protein
MRTRGPRCGSTGPAAAWTGTPPTSLRPTSPAPYGNPPSTPPGRTAACQAESHPAEALPRQGPLDVHTGTGGRRTAQADRRP